MSLEELDELLRESSREDRASLLLFTREYWENCPHGWMLIEAVTEFEGWASHQKLVLAACACAREVLPLVKQPEQGQLSKLLDFAERWAANARVSWTELGSAVPPRLRRAGDKAYAIFESLSKTDAQDRDASDTVSFAVGTLSSQDAAMTATVAAHRAVMALWHTMSRVGADRQIANAVRGVITWDEDLESIKMRLRP